MSDDISAGPGVVVPVEIYLDELDLFGMMHYTRYLGLVDRAWIRHGRRTSIKIDPVTRRPTPWTDGARTDLESLLVKP